MSIEPFPPWNPEDGKREGRSPVNDSDGPTTEDSTGLHIRAVQDFTKIRTGTPFLGILQLLSYPSLLVRDHGV